MGTHINDVIESLSWDTEFFGVDSYKSTICNLQELDLVKKFYDEIDHNCFITIINYKNSDLINRHIEEKFCKSIFLSDINILFSKNISQNNAYSLPKGFYLSYNNKGLTNELIELGSNFIFSRFFNDERLGEKRFDIYKNWIINATNDKDKNFITILDERKIEIGFVLYSCSESSALIELISIDKAHQGMHLGSILVQALCNVLNNRNIHKLYVGTQVSNIDALNFYINNDFKIQRTNTIYHVWKTMKKIEG